MDIIYCTAPCFYVTNLYISYFRPKFQSPKPHWTWQCLERKCRFITVVIFEIIAWLEFINQILIIYERELLMCTLNSVVICLYYVEIKFRPTVYLDISIIVRTFFAELWCSEKYRACASFLFWYIGAWHQHINTKHNKTNLKHRETIDCFRSINPNHIIDTCSVNNINLFAT